MVFDEAHLQVQGDVLGQMAGGVVRFGPEHRTHLIDALMHSDHRLLVELRALGQVGVPAEVVDPKDVGASLGGGGHQLGGLDLHETQPVQVPSESGHRGCRQVSHRPLAWVAPRQRGVVQQGGKLNV